MNRNKTSERTGTGRDSRDGIRFGRTPLRREVPVVTGQEVTLLGQPFYRIGHVDRMSPFFMTIVSDSNHWAFLSSNGGITAGRVNADFAIFPYYTDDKITESVDQAGGKSLFRVWRGGKECLWEPFSRRLEGLHRTERNLYKNITGNTVVFEEINHDLGLCFRAAWRNSDRYGWVRTVWMTNTGRTPCRSEVLDGFLNVMPWGTNVYVQANLSPLLNAYKRHELDRRTGLGIFALSSVLCDRAEPCEALKATTVWQTGLPAPHVALSCSAIDRFRAGAKIAQDTDVRGVAGCYLVNSTFMLRPGETRNWSVVADVAQDHAAVARIKNELQSLRGSMARKVQDDIDRGTRSLTAIVAGVDGLQMTADRMMVSHHFANTLFNAMRGGVFAAGYGVDREELKRYVEYHNRPVFERNIRFLDELPESLTIQDLLDRAGKSGSADLERICSGYLPLSFSRRHGDPSRPWNAFSIRVRKPDGSHDLHYEGNWRDIFQNWEALGYSYPGYIEGFVRTFLSATTADGYNPYRISNHGIDWEKSHPDDPWSNIGYWSDHQIVYLQKLMESLCAFQPDRLSMLMGRKVFSHAAVPYRIRDYAALLIDAGNTIVFDTQAEQQVNARVKRMGADGRLVLDASGEVVHVNLVEKLIILLLAKLTNFVPEGGIWMNTQRPEWNDGNNALVGKGLSMVTVCYLRRTVAFMEDLMASETRSSFAVSEEVGGWFADIGTVLSRYRGRLRGGFTDQARRGVMDGLGGAGSKYRQRIYGKGLSGRQRKLQRRELCDFLAVVRDFLDQTIRANRRADGLYHAYNILHLKPGHSGIGRLDEMLEGQVAVLSSGLLNSAEVLRVLKAMRSSELYRADQHSYMLYPNRLPKSFMERNQIAARDVSRSVLMRRLIKNGDDRLVVKDVQGRFHFNGEFHNERDLAACLARMGNESRYAALVKKDERVVREIFEHTFNHKAFTGRAGSFFAYEGIGSIYWHMVAKLMLAVQENHDKARPGSPARKALAKCYFDIRGGLGFNKTPDHYGAFPSDPYSHTPWGNGARQPGMTGQVKEELLSRLGELGVKVKNGCLVFNPSLLNPHEWLMSSTEFVGVASGAGNPLRVRVPRGGLAFTLCQTPVVYRRASHTSITVEFSDGSRRNINGNACDEATSRHVFMRSGIVKEIRVDVAT